MSKILKLNPYYSEKIWGYENWSLSTHKNGHCTIENSKDTLLEKVEEELPIFVKVIKADDTLSVQVHPDDEFSQKHENDNGKTECWYILEAKDDASLICGIKEGHDKNSFSKVIKDGKIENFSKLKTPYFTVEKICVDKNYEDSVNHDFHSYTVIGGNGSIVSDDQVIELVKEDTVYIPKGVDYSINGNIELLKSYV